MIHGMELWWFGEHLGCTSGVRGKDQPYIKQNSVDRRRVGSCLLRHGIENEINQQCRSFPVIRKLGWVAAYLGMG